MKRQNLLRLSILLMAALFFSFDHEFWLEPADFFLKPGGSTELTVFVGEDFAGDPWEHRTYSVERFEHYFKGGKKKLTKQTSFAQERLPVTLQQAGAHLFVLQTGSKHIELKGPEFTAYLEEDGLENVIEMRKAVGASDQPGKEQYARCAKVLLQAGDATDDSMLKRVGMHLEILPLANPHTVKDGEPLPVRLLLEGKPLPNAMVRFWCKNQGNLSLEKLHTDARGEVSYAMKPGVWMVSAVAMVPLRNSDKADWQSYWASLTFARK